MISVLRQLRQENYRPQTYMLIQRGKIYDRQNMVQWVKVLSEKHHDLSSIPRTHMAELEN